MNISVSTNMFMQIKVSILSNHELICNHIYNTQNHCHFVCMKYSALYENLMTNVPSLVFCYYFLLMSYLMLFTSCRMAAVL